MGRAQGTLSATRRFSACVGAAALLACLGATSAAAAPAITELGTGLANNAEPLAIVAGAEQAVWFGQHSPVGAVDSMSLPSGAIYPHPTLNGAQVVAVARGPEGNIWFSENAGNAKLGMLNPASGIVVEYPQAAPGAKINSMTAGPEGDVWFTAENGAQSAIGRIVPSTGAITEFSLHNDRKPSGITVGAEGDLWITLQGGPPAIEHLSVATKAMQEYPIPGLGLAPVGITTGPEGDIWFTEMTAHGGVGRLVPSSGQLSEFTAGLTQGKTVGIATGGDGNLYVTESGGNGAIARVTPQGTITELTEGLTPKAQPWGIAPGPDGNIYFTERSQPYAIGRVAIATAGPSAPGGPPGGSTPSATLTEAQLKAAAELGTLAGVTPASGKVLVKNSAGKFVRLEGPRVLPLGTVIDSTHGVVRLITALNTRGKTQAVSVWGGVFRITQSKHGNGLTRILLTGPPPRCPKGKAARRPKAAHAASHSSHKSRVLWSKDNHGRYSTHGANSVATVLGTEWETIESCAGTLTRVLKGKVKVQDLHLHRTVTVRAGHSYLARP
jgi:virginiamycin B lyase